MSRSRARPVVQKQPRTLRRKDATSRSRAVWCVHFKSKPRRRLRVQCSGDKSDERYAASDGMRAVSNGNGKGRSEQVVVGGNAPSTPESMARSHQQFFPAPTLPRPRPLQLPAVHTRSSPTLMASSMKLTSCLLRNAAAASPLKQASFATARAYSSKSTVSRCLVSSQWISAHISHSRSRRRLPPRFPKMSKRSRS